MARQTLGQRPGPLLHWIVRTECVVAALDSRHCRKPFTRCLLLLALDDAEAVAEENAGNEREAQRRGIERSFSHADPSLTAPPYARGARASIRWHYPHHEAKAGGEKTWCDVVNGRP